MAVSNGRKKKKNVRHKISIIAIAFVVVALLAVLSVRTMQLRSKVETSDAKIAELQEQIAEEEARTEELEYQKIYVKTKQYVEQIARERLGLVYPGEILIVPED